MLSSSQRYFLQQSRHCAYGSVEAEQTISSLISVSPSYGKCIWEDSGNHINGSCRYFSYIWFAFWTTTLKFEHDNKTIRKWINASRSLAFLRLYNAWIVIRLYPLSRNRCFQSLIVRIEWVSLSTIDKYGFCGQS